MIPKKIHYCWFGRNELPAKAKKCIASWRKYCPDYEIVEWNEDNFDLESNAYIRYCYQNKRWAFLSDLARLMIVEKHGGIYFDTDVELIAPIDHLLEHEAFFGFESKGVVNTGLGFGAMAGHLAVKAMIDEYAGFCPKEGEDFRFIGCPALNTKALLQLGLEPNGKQQCVQGAVILPVDYMNPYDDPTGRLVKTENTVSIHWYTKSALSKKAIIRSKLTRPFHRIFGTDCFSWLKKR